MTVKRGDRVTRWRVDRIGAAQTDSRRQVRVQSATAVMLRAGEVRGIDCWVGCRLGNGGVTSVGGASYTSATGVALNADEVV